jgi:uncharacterized protein YggE
MLYRVFKGFPVCLAFATLASAQSPAPSVVVTTGSASAAVRPTAARLELEIDNRAQSAAQAATENSARLRRLMAALRSLGFTPQQAQVTSYSVRADVDYDTSKLRFYEASAVVTVAVGDLDKLGTVIDSGLASGATEVNHIEYVSDSLASARSRVLGEALQAARKDAEALAQAAGGRLGRLVDVSTIPFPEGSAGAITLQPGQINPSGFITVAPHDVTVALTVYARWEITY